MALMCNPPRAIGILSVYKQENNKGYWILFNIILLDMLKNKIPSRACQAFVFTINMR